MVDYFILIKRKGVKRWAGAIPARKGVSLSSIKAIVRRFVRKGFSAKVVTKKQLGVVRRASKRKVVKRKRRRR